MTVIHIVMLEASFIPTLTSVVKSRLYANILSIYQFKPDLEQSVIDDACNRMTALGTQCVHPETQKSYIKSISGGKNNSTEPVRAPYTYGWIVEFETENDRDFYLKKDPVHLDFVSFMKNIAKDLFYDITQGGISVLEG